MSVTIYCYTSATSGKRYVGQARDVVARWRRHTYAARNGSPTPFHRAIVKYGPGDFAREILDVAITQESADVAEIQWIKRLGTVAPGGYNLAGGGGVRVVHEETRRKMREAAARRSPEERRAHARKAGLGNSSETQAERARSKFLGLSDNDRSAMARGKSTPEQRSATAYARQMAKTPQERAGSSSRGAFTQWSKVPDAERRARMASVRASRHRGSA